MLPSRAIVSSYEFRLNAHKFLNHWEFLFMTKATTFETCHRTDASLAKIMGCSISTVYRTIKSLVEKGIVMKIVTMKGIKKARVCHFNWKTVENILGHHVEKEKEALTRASHHGDRIHPFTVTDNSINSYSKYKGSSSLKIKGRRTITEKSITKIVGVVAGHVHLTSLTAFERETLLSIGGKETLNQDKTNLMRLCGKNNLEFYTVLNNSARL